MREKLRAALVGCGSISEAWRAGVAGYEDLCMVAFVDLDITAARRSAVMWDAPDACVNDDLAAALRHTRPDVVFDCTVPEAHTAVAMTAFAHGAHVLGEKPLADTMANARRAVAAARAAGLRYAVIQNRRYDANIRRLRAFIASGAIGPLTTIHSDFFIGAHFGGFRDSMAHVLLLDMAIHTFDAARYLSGAEPHSVWCREWNPPGSWYARDASAIAVFEMSDGIVYCYRGSWCSEGLATTWESDWRLIGQRGSVRWHGDTRMEAGLADGEQPAIGAQVDPRQTGGHGGLIHDFLRALREGRESETRASDNIRSLAMVHAAIESAQTDRIVPVRY